MAVLVRAVPVRYVDRHALYNLHRKTKICCTSETTCLPFHRLAHVFIIAMTCSSMSSTPLAYEAQHEVRWPHIHHQRHIAEAMINCNTNMTIFKSDVS
jgi:hypothetical protein